MAQIQEELNGLAKAQRSAKNSPFSYYKRLIGLMHVQSLLKKL
ncbi:MAG: hypothetical protein ACW98X_23650 [Promethearchaeota archaeon]